MRPLGFTFVTLLFLILLQSGCDQKSAAPASQPVIDVTVAHPIRQEIVEWDDYNGRLASVEGVDVRARVSGFLQAVKFKEGALVKQGDLLFEIDPAPFQAAYDQAAAGLQQAEAQASYDQAEFKRVESLRGGAISEQQYQSARLAQMRSEAAVTGAKAALQSATLNLGYTKVTAPISGRIGRQIITPGNLITGGTSEGTLLTTIVSLDPIYCYFDADERSVLKYQRLTRERRRQSARENRIPCWMGLADEEGFPHEGTIDFVNNAFDPATGTLQARAVFNNKEAALTPGLFARVRLPGSSRYSALLIPDRAILTDQNQKYVFIIDEKNTARYQKVELGPMYEGLRAITSGLTEQHQVVINGQSRLRPNVPANPKSSPIATTRPSLWAGSSAMQNWPRAESVGAINRDPTTQPSAVPTTLPATQPAMQPAAEGKP